MLKYASTATHCLLAATDEALAGGVDELEALGLPRGWGVLRIQPQHAAYNYAVDSRVKGVQVGPMIDSGGRFYSVSDWYIKTRRMLVTEAEYLGR